MVGSIRLLVYFHRFKAEAHTNTCLAAANSKSATLFAHLIPDANPPPVKKWAVGW
jgi:hypothetical protein